MESQPESAVDLLYEYLNNELTQEIYDNVCEEAPYLNQMSAKYFQER